LNEEIHSLWELYLKRPGIQTEIKNGRNRFAPFGFCKCQHCGGSVSFQLYGDLEDKGEGEGFLSFLFGDEEDRKSFVDKVLQPSINKGISPKASYLAIMKLVDEGRIIVIDDRKKEIKPPEREVFQTETSPCPYCGCDTEREIHSLFYKALEDHLVKLRNGKFELNVGFLCPHCGKAIFVIYWGRLKKDGNLYLMHMQDKWNQPPIDIPPVSSGRIGKATLNSANAPLLWTAYNNVRKRKSSIMDIYPDEVAEEHLQLKFGGLPVNSVMMLNKDSVDTLNKLGRLEDIKIDVESDPSLN
jgi:hypothetical protein